MNHSKVIKYIKSQFKNFVNGKIEYYEWYICNSLDKSIKNQYTLKNPALRECGIIDSLKELNRQLSAENNEYIKHLEERFSYRLSVDSDYVHENTHLYNNFNILAIRIKNYTTNLMMKTKIHILIVKYNRYQNEWSLRIYIIWD